MNPIVLPIAALAGLFAFLVARRDARAASPPAASSRAAELAWLKEVITDAHVELVTSGKVRQAADVADRLGYPSTAQGLRQLAASWDARDGVAPAVEGGPPLVVSPWPDVPDDAWREFVRRLALRPGCVPMPRLASSVEPDYRLGLFGYGARRLAELGLGVRPRQDLAAPIDQYVGDRPVWVMEWVPPLSLAAFLSDAPLQYQVLEADMVRARDWIAQHAPGALGRELAGERATLSGLLAVEKAAGTAGLTAWASSPEDWTKFPRTTEAYRRLNGLF